MFALIFHACVGRSGSIEGLLVRDSQTSESLCCVLEQDTETGIKQKDKKSSRSDWDEKYKSKQIFYRLLITGSIQVDPSPQDRKIVESDVKNQAMQVKTSKRTNQKLLLCLSGLTLTNSCEVPPNMLSHPNPINPPHAPFGSFEKDILMSRTQCYSTGC